jgi:hypothetical protein
MDSVNLINAVIADPDAYIRMYVLVSVMLTIYNARTAVTGRIRTDEDQSLLITGKEHEMSNEDNKEVVN